MLCPHLDAAARRVTKVNVYLDGRFSYGMLLSAGESIPADFAGITYRVVDALIAAEKKS